MELSANSETGKEESPGPYWFYRGFGHKQELKTGLNYRPTVKREEEGGSLARLIRH